MRPLHDSNETRRKPWRFGACGEEWVAVLFLLVAIVGVLAERVDYVAGPAGIV